MSTRLLQLLCLMCTCLITVRGEFRRVCYYSGWAVYRNPPNNLEAQDIGPALCTHLVFAFANIVENSTQLKADSARDIISYTEFMGLKQKNPKLKTLLAVGGWTMGSQPFTYIVKSSYNMHEFANNTIPFLRAYGFDGIAIDWVYPAARGSPPEDKRRFTRLLQVVQSAFNNELTRGSRDRLLLTVAAGASEERANDSYEIRKMSRYVDFIDLMMYDFHGQWEDAVNVHSSLYSNDSLNIDYLVKSWVSHGAEKNKLNIGVPFYGRKYNLANTVYTGVGAAHVGGGDMPYFEICELIKSRNVTEHILPTERVPYIVSGNLWVGYDNVQSITEKVEYVKTNQYGGVMVFAIDLDDTTGSCGKGRFPLMNAIKNAFSGPDTVPVG